jgi:hypothetical protein
MDDTSLCGRNNAEVCSNFSASATGLSFCYGSALSYRTLFILPEFERSASESSALLAALSCWPLSAMNTTHRACVLAFMPRKLVTASLRMDDGSQYTSDDLRDQIRFWGFAPSYAFVAERFNRTMKEQAIHGRIFNNLGGSSCRRRVQGSIQSATGVLKSWASNHPLKPVRHR